MAIRTCNYCDIPHQAFYYCQDCEEDMCELMKTAHLKAKLSKHHTVTEIEVSTPLPPFTTVALLTEMICHTHLDSYRYYDEVCGCRICRDCFALNHYGHKCIPISEAMLEKRGQCEGSYVKGRRQYEEVCEMLRESKKKKEKLDESYQQIKVQIQTHLQSIMKAAENRQQFLIQQLDNLYLKFQSSFSKGQEDLEAAGQKLSIYVEEIKAALDKYLPAPTPSLVVAPPAPLSAAIVAGLPVRDTALEEMNKAFSLFANLQSRNSVTSDECLRSSKTVEEWKDQALLTYSMEKKELQSIVEKVSSFGQVIEGDGSGKESRAEGEGLSVYRDKEESFIVRAYYRNGKKKEVGGDIITLELGERDEKGNALSSFERSIQATVIDKKNGEYKISYRALARELEGKIPLHVRLNKEDIKCSPFAVCFESKKAVAVTLLEGSNYSISSDGLNGTAVAGQSYCWCQINPIPENLRFSFQIFMNPKNTYRVLYFLEEKDSVAQIIGHHKQGRFTWNLNDKTFYENQISKLVTTADPSIFSLQLVSGCGKDKLLCYGDNVLLYTFNLRNGQKYKLIFDTFWEGSSVKLLP